MICAIDFGTTSLKVSVLPVYGSENDSIASQQLESNADVVGLPPGYREQSPYKIFDNLKAATTNILLHLNDVDHVIMAGQMHGIVTWEDVSFDLSADLESVLESARVSNLITWEDQRLTDTFLAENPSIHPGYGLASLLFENYGSASSKMSGKYWGSIMDFFAWMFLGCPRNYTVKTTSQLANSFGYFDPLKNSFDYDTLRARKFPVETLPSIVSDCTIMGLTKSTVLGFPEGVKVLVPMGDTQCAFYSVIRSCTDSLVLNLGTSCQIGKVLSSEEIVLMTNGALQGLEFFPYIGETFLAVFASMNGGNNLEQFVEHVFAPLICGVLNDSDKSSPPIDDIYKVFIDAGILEHCRGSRNPGVQFQGGLYSERNSHSVSASTSHASLLCLSSLSCNLGQISLAIHRGLINNARDVFIKASNGKLLYDKVVAVGNIFRKNQLLNKLVREIFPGCVISDSDSSRGAALFVRDNVKNLHT